MAHTKRSLLPYFDGNAYTRYFAASYDFVTQLSGWRAKIARHALDGITPGRMLDVGYGTGFLMHLARRGGFRVRGVDPSRGMLAKGSRRYGFSDRELRLASADRLPFSNASFDFVIACGSLCYVPNISEAAKEMLRVLKPGGRLRLIDHASPLQCDRWTGLFLIFSQLSGDLLHDYPHYFSPGAKLIRRRSLGRGGLMQRFDFIKKPSYRNSPKEFATKR